MNSSSLYAISEIMKYCVLVIFSGIALSFCFGAEIAKHTAANVPPPDFSGARRATGEDLLLLQVVERNKLWDDGDTTTFYTFNPSVPEDGLVKIFQGPGQNQYCRMLTPLFNGWGVAHANMNDKQEPKKRRMFWYNLLSGARGATIDDGLYDERICGEYLVYLSDKPCRYNLRSGELLEIDVDIRKCHFINRSTIVTETSLDDAVYIITLDVSTLEINRIVKVPKKMQQYDRVFLAGEDGAYIISGSFDGFSLWYCPKGKTWRPVVENVHIVKTFGGAAPGLPVKYLGNGRFAVAKTIKDKVDKEPEDTFPKALSITLLVDGANGEVIDQSDEVVYDHNPPLIIKDDWMQHSEESTDRSASRDSDRMFRWIESEKSVEVRGWKKIHTGPDDKFSLSRSHRFLAIYRKWNSDWGEEAKYLKFTILDGKKHTLHEEILKSEKKTIFITRFSWLQLTGDTVDKMILDQYTPSALDPFRDPGVFE